METQGVRAKTLCGKMTRFESDFDRVVAETGQLEEKKKAERPRTSRERKKS